MSKPVASFLLAQLLVAGVLILTLFIGTSPTIVAGGQTTPTVFPTATPSVTPTPGVTPVPTFVPTPTPTLGPPTTNNDAFTVLYNNSLDVPPPGVLGNDQSNGGGSMTAQLVSGPAYGNLTLFPSGAFLYTPTCVGAQTFTYRAVNAAGPGNTATVTLFVQDTRPVQPPCDLYVSSIVGNDVTVRWQLPAIGPAPTGFDLRGGVNPNEVLASIPTGSPFEIFTFTAPSGAFYIRLHSRHTSSSGSVESAPSNEIPLYVNVPQPPSAPDGLVGLVNGPNLSMAWQNTYQGGAPTSLVLDVSGSVNATLPLGLSDTFSFANVPTGTYTLQLRGANAGGVGPPSNPLSLSFPGPCSGVPSPPVGVLPYRVGNTVFVVWDPAATGWAPTGFVLDVSGAFTGSFPTTTRGLSGTVGPGTYNLGVRATNPCGTSASSAVRSITVP